jgi:hypothetical protein
MWQQEICQFQVAAPLQLSHYIVISAVFGAVFNTKPTEIVGYDIPSRYAGEIPDSANGTNRIFDTPRHDALAIKLGKWPVRFGHYAFARHMCYQRSSSLSR